MALFPLSSEREVAYDVPNDVLLTGVLQVYNRSIIIAIHHNSQRVPEVHSSNDSTFTPRQCLSLVNKHTARQSSLSNLT